MTREPIDIIEDALNAHSTKVKRRGDTIIACCPAHDDNNPSLSAKPGDRGRDVVLHCHAGCDPDDVIAALGLAWTDLSESTWEPPRPNVTIVAHDGAAEYPYLDADGETVYVVVREPGKKFRQKRPDGQGGWVWNLEGVERIPYHLPQLRAACARGEHVWIAEGEKDVQALEWAGATVATCNSGGAGRWTTQHAEHLAGASGVTIVADRDEPGRNHARSVRDSLRGIVGDVRIVEARVGKDAADHIEAGHGLDEFIEWADDQPEWPEAVPLSSRVDNPPFPVGALPHWMQAHVLAVAHEQQVAADLPAMLGLAALSMTCAGHHRVHVQGDWHENLNLYVVVAMPPSSGKSPVYKRMVRAIERYEADLAEWGASERDIVEQKRRMISKRMKSAEEIGDESEASTLLKELKATPEVAVPRLIVSDATVEALVKVLGEQNGRIALMSTEGGPFDGMAGRYTDKANLDPYLQAWSGDVIRVDRVNRDAVVLRNPLLTVGLTVQPSTIEALAAKPEFKGRGLTARFMYSVPEDYVGRRNFLEIPAGDKRAADDYDRRLHALVSIPVPAEPEVIEIAADAWRRFAEWRQGLEERRVPTGDLRPMAEWTTKLESSVARLAGLLHVAEGRTMDITDDIMVRAITIGEYWLQHAQIVHDMWGADEVTVKAKAVLSWLTESRTTEFTLRDVQRGRRALFPAAADAVEPLRLLLDFGWIRQTNDSPLVAGRRGKDSPAFETNPALWITPSHVPHVTHVPKGTNNSSSSSLGKRPLRPPESRDMRDMSDMSDQRKNPTTTPPRRRPSAADVGL